MAEIRVPTLGESVTEATIGKWFKKPGDPVAVDEPLVELETDKVTIEVPAAAANRGQARGCGAARAFGAQAGRRNRHRCLDRSRLRQGWPRDQGRHDGG